MCSYINDYFMLSCDSCCLFTKYKSAKTCFGFGAKIGFIPDLFICVLALEVHS